MSTVVDGSVLNWQVWTDVGLVPRKWPVSWDAARKPSVAWWQRGSFPLTGSVMPSRLTSRTWPTSSGSRARARETRPGTATRRCVGRPEKLVAQAVGRVLARNVAAGRSVEYPALLVETDTELAAMHKRLKRDARMLRRARKQIRETQLRIAAGALSCVGAPADARREPPGPDMAPGPPPWHPEHRLYPGNNI